MQAEQRNGEALCIRGTLKSTPEAVTASLRKIRAHLEDCPTLSQLDGTWEIVVAEVLNNIVEHAYAGDPQGDISLELDFAPSALCANFRDAGNAMPGNVAPAGKAADLDVPTEDMPEGGFGWHLIRMLTRELEYERVEDRNHLTIEMDLARQE